MITLYVQKLSLYVLVCIILVPYVASSLGLGESLIYNAEIIALASWYIASLIIPLTLKELDTAFVLWYVMFVLVGVAVGSDMVYRIHVAQGMDFSPANWYSRLGGLTRVFYSFMESWLLLMMPGWVLFLVMVFGRRVYWKSEETTKPT